MYCKKCSIKIAAGRYCPECGNRLRGVLLPYSFQKEISKKKIVVSSVILVVMMTVTLLIPCMIQGSSRRFMTLMDKGEYETAREYYENNIDEKEEAKMRKAFSKKVTVLYEKLNKGKLSYDEVVQYVNLYAAYFKEEVKLAKQDFVDLYESKKNFESGEVYFEEENYLEAMKAYYRVIEKDTNYTNAKKKFDNCYETVVNNVLSLAENAVEKGNYIEASYQLNAIRAFLKEEDIQIFEEKENGCADGFLSNIKAAMQNFGEETRTVTNKENREIVYDEIRDISITDIVNKQDHLLVNMVVTLSDGITVVDVQYEAEYVKEQVWKMESLEMKNVISVEPIVYAIEEQQTYGGKYEETKIESTYLYLYNKEDDTLAQVWNAIAGFMYECEYVDGKLKLINYDMNYADYNGTEYYNEKGQITSKYAVYRTGVMRSWSYSYDAEGHLINCTELQDNIITRTTDYIYENGVLKEKIDVDNGVTDREVYHYGDNNVLLKKEVTYGSEYGYEFYDVYYYTYDENGKLLSITTNSDVSDNTRPYVLYTYYTDGTVESITQYFSSRSIVSQMEYFDTQGRLIRKYDYSADGDLRSELVYEYNERDEVIRVVKYDGYGKLSQENLYENIGQHTNEIIRTYDYNGEIWEFLEVNYIQWTDAELLERQGY